MLNRAMAEHTGQDMEKVKADTERDFYMTAAEAAEYGLIDEVINHKSGDEEDGESDS